MSGNPEEYRAHAHDCLRLAEGAASPEITRMFVDLAHSWTKLALELQDAEAYMDAIGHAPSLDPVETKKGPSFRDSDRRWPV